MFVTSYHAAVDDCYRKVMAIDQFKDLKLEQLNRNPPFVIREDLIIRCNSGSKN